ncbi:MAG: acylneuraminate cytidylyltransferase family protein [Bacteroidetes bacterium CHB5]|nr:acylneuraminate cytidylyltransferase family protein [Bacteroidetes bacterium CHB5]
MKILGIIPARGGSKGVPNKNIKLLGDRPLIQYTIDAARQSKLLSKIIVSTDSESIAEYVKKSGDYIPFMRPGSLALDSTPTLPVIQHALQFYLKKKEKFDAVCLLQVTTPFRMPGFIDRAINRFMEQGCDALISVLPVPTEFNPHWIFEPGEQGLLKIATGDEKIIPRRQDLPPAFYRDGSVYITRTDVLLEQNSLYGCTLGYIENNPQWHVNIDTPDDWKEAERNVINYISQCAQ